MNIKLKRAYDDYAKNDGTRVLVDRLWPRGIKKEDAKIDLWLKELSPTSELRKWFNHDVDKWDEFKSRYTKELDKNSEQIQKLRQAPKSNTLTLVYAAKDEQHNNAIVIKNYLENH